MIYKKEIKRTRGNATDNIILQILKDIYVKSPIFQPIVDFYIALGKMPNPTIDQKLDEKINEEWTPNEKINIAWDVINEATDLLIHGLKKPLEYKKGTFTANNRAEINYWENNTAFPLWEIKEKYDISYPTIQKRLSSFFCMEKRSKWKTHFKYLIPKIEVLITIARYYAEQELLKKNKNLYSEISKIFKNENI